MLKSNRILILLGILFLVCSSLFHRVMFDDYLFLTQDTISAKSVKHGIEASTKEFDEYPIWLPWMFSGLPSTHSMQNISEYYLPHHIISLIKAINVPWFWNYLLHFLMDINFDDLKMCEGCYSKYFNIFCSYLLGLKPYLNPA